MIKIILNIFLVVSVLKNVECDKKTLAFVFDATGSMSDDLAQLRSAAKVIANHFDSLAEKPIANYILVVYHDPDVEPTVVTSSKEVLFQKLDAITLAGGYNECDEVCYKGIQIALETPEFRKDSYMLVFTDAGSTEDYRIPIIEKLASKKKTQIFFFAQDICTAHNSKPKYEKLAQDTNGMYLNVPRNDISDVLTSFYEIVNEKRTTIESLSSPAGTVKKPLRIDGSMDEVLMTFSGAAGAPSIKIVDPNNNDFTNFKVLASKTNVKIIQFKPQTPGLWTLDLASSGGFSGQVSSISNLSFRYGFSTTQPEDIHKTAYQPLTGTSNFLAISPSNNSLVSNLELVELMYGTNESLKLTLNKTVISKTDVLYVTDKPFDLSHTTFKIKIHGLDNNANQIVRLVSPTISSIPAGSPEMDSTLEMLSVDEDQPIPLLCQFATYATVNINWQKEGSSIILKQMETNKSDVLNYTINAAGLEHSGKYICTASNSLGTTKLETVVVVRPAPFSVVISDGNQNTTEGKSNVVLGCKVSPKKTTTVHWLFNGNKILPQNSRVQDRNLILDNVNRSFSGEYTCVGTKGTEGKSAVMTLNVKYLPSITKLLCKMSHLPNSYELDLSTTNPIDVYNDTSSKYICESSGNPTPNSVWFNEGNIISNTNELNINRNAINDGSIYTCNSTNDVGTVTNSITFNVFNKPMVLSSKNYNIDAQINQEARLECPIEGKDIKVAWKFNNIDVNTNQRVDNKLIIKSVNLSNNGTYTCTGTNKAGLETATLTMNVLEFPKIESILVTMNGVKTLETEKNTLNPIELYNDTITRIKCVGSGNPSPIVAWSYGTTEITSNELSVSRSNAIDNVPYKCIAKNDLGFEERFVKFKIYENPKPKFGYQNVYDVKINSPFTLECPIGGRELNFKWMFNSKPIDNKYLTNERINIRKVDLSMSGKYSCIGANKAGQSFASITLNVLNSPSIDKITLESADTTRYEIGSSITNPIELYNGTIIRINCGVSGNPPPIVTWSYGTKVITSNELSISRSNASDNVPYKCIAKNDLGFDDRLLKFKIYENPKPKLGYQNVYDVKINSPFTLECPIDGRELIFKWMFNNKPMESKYLTNDKINIRAVEISLAGKYSCIASNKAGQSHASITLNVMYPPTVTKITLESADTAIHEIESSFTNPIELYNNTEVILTCETSGYPYPTITWYRQGIEISKSRELKVKRSNAFDKTPYTCKAINSESSAQKAIYFKIINEPILKTYVGNLRVKINSPLNIECPLENFDDIKIEWKFKNSRLPSSAVVVNDRLKIGSVHYPMEGEYSCTASNKAGKVNAVFNLILEYPPVSLNVYSRKSGKNLMSHPKNHHVLKLSTVDNLFCNSNGNPPPQINWVSIIEGIETRINSNEIEISTDGDYVCIADNHLGNPVSMRITANYIKNIQPTINYDRSRHRRSIKSPITLLDIIPIMPEDEYFNSDFEKTYEKRENEYLELNCEVNLGTYPIWFKNNKQMLTREAVLVFRSLKITDNGVYKCFQRHTNKEVSILFYVHVLKEPEIPRLETFEITEVNENQEFNITCQSSGNPLPLLEMYDSKGKLLVSNEYFLKSSKQLEREMLHRGNEIYIDTRNGRPISGNIGSYPVTGIIKWSDNFILSLTYDKIYADRTDGQIYKCIVKSSNDKRLISSLDKLVKISTLPKLDSKTIEQYQLFNIVPGASFHLLCPIVGDPKPKIEWQIPSSIDIKSDPHMKIDNYKKKLIFNDVQIYHRGEYKCRGTNEAGSFEIVYALIVEDNAEDLMDPEFLDNFISQEVKTAIESPNTLRCPFKNTISAKWYDFNSKKEISSSYFYNFNAGRDELIYCTPNGKNSYGKIFDIKVLEKPHLKTDKKNLRVKNGDGFMLTCYGSGYPKPVPMWYKRVGSKFMPLRSTKYQSVEENRFVVKNAISTNAGSYKCKDKNKIYKSVITYNVIVY